MTSTSKPRRGFALLLAFVFVVAACSGDDATSSTIDPADVVFGSGSIPETVPADFPVPDEAVISSTLINRPAGTTEMVMRLPVGVEVVVAYYEQNLEARGYDVVSSEATSGGGWEMESEKDGLTISKRFTLVGNDLTEAVLIFQE